MPKRTMDKEEVADGRWTCEEFLMGLKVKQPLNENHISNCLSGGCRGDCHNAALHLSSVKETLPAQSSTGSRTSTTTTEGRCTPG